MTKTSMNPSWSKSAQEGQRVMAFTSVTTGPMLSWVLRVVRKQSPPADLPVWVFSRRDRIDPVLSEPMFRCH